MKFAVLSDTHFGNPTCGLVKKQGNKVIPGDKYERFKAVVGTDNDYLFLVGDIFDFSITSYDTAYAWGKPFFEQLQKDRLIKENENGAFGPIVYMPGNHDADIWHIIQHQRNVINRILRGENPLSFTHSVAGILDDRSDSPARGFMLSGVKTQPDTGTGKYGGMFLDKITRPETVFYFAYPNVYILTDKESVLVTHGQYLETFWSFAGEFVTKVAYNDLGPYDTPEQVKLDAERLVSLNFPLNQLACTGIGQAGILTDIIRQVQDDVYANKYTGIERYADNFDAVINQLGDNRLTKKIFNFLWRHVAKPKVLKEIKKIQKTRFNDKFMAKEVVRERFKKFYQAGILEIDQIVADSKKDPNIPAYDMPYPDRIIFGHTHDPVAWNDLQSLPPIDLSVHGKAMHLTLHNTGGWIVEDGKFCGAEIFKYETGCGFYSERIE